jgi:hypothetical protein
MRLYVTDDAPANLSYPYVDGQLEAGDEFEVDEEKAAALLDTHDYLREADIVLEDDEYTVEDADADAADYDEPLEDQTYDDLRDIAGDLDIEGRGSMDKTELIDAIEAADTE